MLWNYPLPDIDKHLPAGREPLSEDKNADGKSLLNPEREGTSEWYQGCPEVIGVAGKTRSDNIFDFHIYYPASGPHFEYARKLHEAIRREFPELRVYRFWDRPVGPHPVPMFEVNVFTPAQLGALMSYLVVYRGPLSVLIHPNAGQDLAGEVRDHTERATWMGERYPLIAFQQQPLTAE